MLNTTTEANAEPMATAMARPRAVTLEAVQTVQKLLLLFIFYSTVLWGQIIQYGTARIVYYTYYYFFFYYTVLFIV